MSIDKPGYNDNRNYDYTANPDEKRAEYGIILSLIKNGSTVTDLGCGNGTLLEILRREKGCTVSGIEIAESGVTICKQKGLYVVQGRIDEQLPYTDQSFDYAICNVTLQMVQYPEKLLNEMERVAKYSIISFPNFAYYKNRLELFMCGIMPRKMLFGYQWFNTGHIHQLSIRDFKEFIKNEKKMHINKFTFAPTGNTFIDFAGKYMPNLFCYLPVFLVENDK